MGAGRSVTFPRVVKLLSKEVEKIGQRGTARATGVAQQAIHRFLKGNSEPSQATLEKLAAYFGVSVPWLRGYDETESRGPTAQELWVIAEIREALGVGDDVALADLPGIIRTLRVEYGGLKALLEDDLK